MAFVILLDNFCQSWKNHALFVNMHHANVFITITYSLCNFNLHSLWWVDGWLDRSTNDWLWMDTCRYMDGLMDGQIDPWSGLLSGWMVALYIIAQHHLFKKEIHLCMIHHAGYRVSECCVGRPGAHDTSYDIIMFWWTGPCSLQIWIV